VRITDILLDGQSTSRAAAAEPAPPETTEVEMPTSAGEGGPASETEESPEA
jgi:hypothetical protein